jgi:hypothetical protein
MDKMKGEYLKWERNYPADDLVPGSISDLTLSEVAANIPQVLSEIQASLTGPAG